MFQVDFNAVHLTINLVRFFKLEEVGLKIDGNFVVKRENSVFFADGEAFYEFDIRYGQVFLLHRFASPIAGFDVQQSLYLFCL